MSAQTHPGTSEADRGTIEAAPHRRLRHADFAVPYSTQRIDLTQFDTRSKAGFTSKEEALAVLADDTTRLAELHDVFAAQSHYALLIVLQGMDASGKDGIVKHVMAGMNPQGVNVYSFRKPSDEEQRHDFLWRENKVLPERGRMAIFNRSYYEEVLAVRVQPELLEKEAAEGGAYEWHHRFDAINAFERHLTHCGTVIFKFFLHISKDEQRERLLERLETPNKMWKVSDADLEGHAQWDSYIGAYEKMLGRTSTQWAPWYVVPADRKWSARAVVGSFLTRSLERLKLHYPEPSRERQRRLAEFAQQLRGT